jgi:hypothetical protein
MIAHLRAPTLLVQCDRCGTKLRCARSEIDRKLVGWMRVNVYALPDAIAFDLEGGQLVAEKKDFCPVCVMQAALVAEAI